MRDLRPPDPGPVAERPAEGAERAAAGDDVLGAVQPGEVAADVQGRAGGGAMNKTLANARAVLDYLQRCGPSGASVGHVGDAIWGRVHRKPQHYARPAGRLLHWMKRRGLVQCPLNSDGFFWWRLDRNWKNAALKVGIAWGVA